jgi:hypothetical protein
MLSLLPNRLWNAAGRYDTSDEFAKERLKLDAISRFGIGFLSCFMVADQVTIKSRRLSRYGGDDEGIIVTIPNIDRHFEIVNFTDHSWEGSSVRLEILPEKMATLAGDGGMPFVFKITEYLKEIAGFVETPIFIEEGTSRLLILHPAHNSSHRPRGVPRDVKVWQAPGKYRWNDEFQKFLMCPDPAFLSEYRVDLEKDLGLANIEGFVSLPVPCSLSGDMHFRDNGMLRSESLVVTGEDGNELPTVTAASLDSVVRFKSRNEIAGDFPSTLVYQNGIYITGEGQRDDLGVTSQHSTI